jgi:hypothetical protein
MTAPFGAMQNRPPGGCELWSAGWEPVWPATRPIVMGVRRWLVPLLAALAVLAVVAVVWSQRPGASGGDGVDIGFAGGGSDGAGSPPYGGSEPGSPGPSDGPDRGSEPSQPSQPPADGPDDGGPGGGTRDVDAGSIAVDSYFPYDARHLALNYANGVPACYGRAGLPVVEETPESVVVTIPRTPVKPDPDRVCIDLAVLGSVDVTLSSPLAGRPVLDGARDGAVVDPAAAPNDPDQAR